MRRQAAAWPRGKVSQPLSSRENYELPLSSFIVQPSAPVKRSRESMKSRIYRADAIPQICLDRRISQAVPSVLTIEYWFRYPESHPEWPRDGPYDATATAPIKRRSGANSYPVLGKMRTASKVLSSLPGQAGGGFFVSASPFAPSIFQILRNPDETNSDRRICELRVASRVSFV